MAFDLAVLRHMVILGTFFREKVRLMRQEIWCIDAP